LELSQSLLSDYRALLTRYPHPTDME